MGVENLCIANAACIKPLNAGLFVSPGRGRHVTRTINSHELLFVTSGTLDLFEEEEALHLQRGDALVLWPNRLHGGATILDKDLAFYWIHFRVHDHAARESSAALTVPRRAHLLEPERLTDLFRRYIDDQETEQLEPFEAALLIALMLSEVAHAQERCSRSDCRSLLAERVHQYISRHFSEPISTTDVAAHLRYNPDYLGRAFRMATGTSVTEAIHRRKVKEARTLLTRDHLTVREVAYSCGFRDPGYFRRVFKTTCGMTPREFRDLFSHLHINTH
jgi:AraC-like DNA-binding protein